MEQAAEEGKDDEEKEEEEEKEEKEEDDSADAAGGGSASPALKSSAAKKFKPETDFQRLIRELHLEYLDPVRVALGLSFRTKNTLTERSCLALFDQGLSVEELVDKGYPKGIVEVFAATLAKKFKTI